MYRITLMSLLSVFCCTSSYAAVWSYSAVARDSAVAAADSVTVSSDSAVDTADSVTVSPDSAVDTADSVTVSPDSAAYAADSVAAVPAQTSVRNVPNAMKYSMQKRWRPNDERPFTSYGFFDNSFISFLGSGYRIGRSEYSSGPRFGIAYGKWLNPHHALRLTGDVGYFFDNFDGRRVKQIGVKASYLFNLSSYLGGYRPSRCCEISTVIGLGYLYTWRRANSGKNVGSNSLTGHVGLDFNIHLFRGVDIFVEPLFDLSLCGISLERNNNWRKYLPAFNGVVGISCRLDSNSKLTDAAPQGNWFVSISSGPQIQNSYYVMHKIPFKDAVGFHAALSAGRTLKPFFALRFSAGFSQDAWDVVSGGEVLKTDYYLARLEGIFDFVRVFKKAEDSRFSASVLFGPEIGFIAKHDINNTDIVVPYVGMTGGVQAKARIEKGFSLFVEPRFSYVPYPAPSNDRTSVCRDRNYYDAVLNCNIGIEYFFK